MNNTYNINVLSFYEFKSKFFEAPEAPEAEAPVTVEEVAEESAEQAVAASESEAAVKTDVLVASSSAAASSDLTSAASGESSAETPAAAAETEGPANNPAGATAEAGTAGASAAESAEPSDIQTTIAALFKSPSSNNNYTIQLNDNKKLSIKINDNDIPLDNLIRYMINNPNQNPPEKLKQSIKKYVQSKHTNASNLLVATKMYLFQHGYFLNVGGGKKKLSKKLFIKNKKQTKKNKLTNK